MHSSDIIIIYAMCLINECATIYAKSFLEPREYEHDTREYSNKLCRDTVLRLFGLFTFLSHPEQLRNSMIRFSPRYRGDSKK